MTWSRLKAVVTGRILGVSDTPHRIAWGVFIGTVVAFTPTIGLQIVLYLALATLLRANKLSGVPILFISNPVTAVPLYWFCWKIGAFFLPGDPQSEGVEIALAREGTQSGDFWSDIWTTAFWDHAFDTLVAMGAEMWFGSLFLGVVCGIPLYFLTLFGVRAFRRL